MPWMKIRQILDDLTEGHFWHGYQMSGEWGIFLGRIDTGTDLFENVSQMFCRDPGDVKNYGRCCRPSVAVYCRANNLDTVVLFGLSPKVGDRVYVAVARPKVNAEVVLTAIGDIDYLRRHSWALIGNKESMTIIQGLLDNVKSESELRKTFLDAFMTDLFITSASHASDYKANFRPCRHWLTWYGNAKRRLDLKLAANSVSLQTGRRLGVRAPGC